MHASLLAFTMCLAITACGRTKPPVSAPVGSTTSDAPASAPATQLDERRLLCHRIGRATEGAAPVRLEVDQTTDAFAGGDDTLEFAAEVRTRVPRPTAATR
jgi:hypothetical protein